MPYCRQHGARDFIHKSKIISITIFIDSSTNLWYNIVYVETKTVGDFIAIYWERVMNIQIEDIEKLLDAHAGGFRCFSLVEPFEHIFVSKKLCDMTGYSREELGGEFTEVIHPDDVRSYAAARAKLAKTHRTVNIEYRIICRDGKVMYVCDTLSAQRQSDGTCLGFSTCTDVTGIKSENANLRFLNDTVPCGMIRYTCEKHPKITYVNEQMKRIMRIPQVRAGELDYMDMYRDNILLIVAPEERRVFTYFLSQVKTKGKPVAGELSVIRCDGTRARLYGWVTRVVTDSDREEFQSVCMDITERYQSKKMTETERYIKALSEVYDAMFEYDFSTMTVKYIHGDASDTFGRIRNIPMQMEETVGKWIESTVVPRDRQRMRAYFEDIIDRQRTHAVGRPPQIDFFSVTADGSEKPFTGIFLKTDRNVSLFCLRASEDRAETDSLRSENLSLKNMTRNMREVVMRFTEGIAAFEVTEDKVIPLYASDNVCEFFGFTKEEWLPMMKRSTPLKDFVARSGVGYERFAELLATGEAEFSYFDHATHTQRRMKAICSEKHADGATPRYVMLYNVEGSSGEKENNEGKAKVYIRTFGYFDVFVDGKPIAFRNKKAKELLALLVDRRGGYVTSEEAISFLWETEPVNTVTLSRYRKEALRLKNTLEEYGISDIMESVDGKRRIVTENVSCDLYGYLAGSEEFAQSFKGSYLSNYSWGETTLGELLNENLY